MVGPSAPSGEHSHRAAPPPDPSVPTPCQEAPAPELPVRFAAGRIDWQQAAYRQRIGTDRVGEEEKCAPPRGFAPGTRSVRNVLNNLRGPVILFNDMLQGEPRRAGDTLGRFLLNSTFGVAGRSEERRVGKECRSRWSP